MKRNTALNAYIVFYLYIVGMDLSIHRVVVFVWVKIIILCYSLELLNFACILQCKLWHRVIKIKIEISKHVCTK